MKPETLRYLAKARDFLDKAERMLLAEMADEAGRAAYLAGFHAAQAFIFESTDVVAKSHGGVHSQFAKLIRDVQAFDVRLRPFLGRAYNMKAIADYSVEHVQISRESAEVVLVEARSFVEAVADAIRAVQPP